MSAVKMKSVQTSDIRPLTNAELEGVSGGLLGVAIAVVLAIDAILITDAAIRTHCSGTLNEGLHR